MEIPQKKISMEMYLPTEGENKIQYMSIIFAFVFMILQIPEDELVW